MTDPAENEVRELRRERDLLRALIGSTPTFFVAIDAEGRTRVMNRAMLQALGYTEEQVIGTDYLQTFVPVEDREALTEVFDRIVKKRQRTLNENRVLTREGREILVEWHGTPMFDEHGELEYFFGVGTDITERRHRHLQIAEKEARFRALMDHTRDAIVLAHESGEILDANERACSLLGYRRWELGDRTVTALGLPSEVRAEPADAALPTKDGTRLSVRHSAAAYEIEDRSFRLHVFWPA